MCLAIVMYLVTGTVSFIWQFLVAAGASLLDLIGKTILMCCASVYTVSRPGSIVARLPELPDELPAALRDPEPLDLHLSMPATKIPPVFEEDYDTMARMSLETVTSEAEVEGSPRVRRKRLNGLAVHRPSRRSAK